MRRRKLIRHRRSGLTLLEVILSLGIFLAAMTVITQLQGTGTRAAIQGSLQNEATLRCASKLAELVSGVAELNPVDGQSFEDGAEGWTWGLIVEDAGQGDLLRLTVTVSHENATGTVDAEYVLTRFMRDPDVYLNAAVDE